MDLVDFAPEMQPLVSVRRLPDGQWEAALESVGLAATAATVGEAQVALRDLLTSSPDKLAALSESAPASPVPATAAMTRQDRIALLASWPGLDLADLPAATGTMVVDFWKQDCGICLSMAPAVHRIADELSDHLQFRQVNAYDQPEVAQHFGVTTLPTIVIVRDGVEVHRLVGPRGATVLESELASWAPVDR